SGVTQVNGRLFEDVLPANLDAVALHGSLSLEAGGMMFPSATGDLSLMAAQDLRLFSRRFAGQSGLKMSDADAALKFPSPAWKLTSAFNGATTRYEVMNLHREDLNPVRLYALEG